jgi:hypothetical protein
MFFWEMGPTSTMARRDDVSPLIKHLNQKPRGTLYHYTSMDALQKIIERGSVWATDIHYLNDSSEYTNAKEFVKKLLSERLADDESLRTRVLPEIEQLQQKQDEDIFVASFSEAGDSLPQWRGYCGNGLGVSIGFIPWSITTGILEEPEGKKYHRGSDETPDCRLLKCVYTEKDKARLINENIESYLDAVQGKHHSISAKSSGRFLASVLNLCGPLFKNGSFAEEKEWRYVVACKEPDFPKRHFRVGRSTYVPYIEVDVRANYSPDYITEVVIGPTPNPMLAERSLLKLLRTHNLYRSKVRNSSIPYRTW